MDMSRKIIGSKGRRVTERFHERKNSPVLLKVHVEKANKITDTHTLHLLIRPLTTLDQLDSCRYRHSARIELEN